jgi:hypothetical protein
LIEAAKEEKGEELTPVETVQVAGPVYIPAIVTGVSTIACIFGANALNKRQQAALMSAYALLDSSYKEYKAKVEELYGKESAKQIRTEIAKDHYIKDEIPADEDDGKTLFYDEFSNRYFRSTMEEVLRAEYSINRDLVMRDYAYLNEFYDYLGLEPIETGWDYGWTPALNMERCWQEWLDFGHDKFTTDDGLEGCIVTIYCQPVLYFQNY